MSPFILSKTYRKHTIHTITILAFSTLISNQALGYILFPLGTSKNFRSCSLTDNGNNTSTGTVTFEFLKNTSKEIQGRSWISRGLLIYLYDKSGSPQITTKIPVSAISLNGIPAVSVYTDKTYSIYLRRNTLPWSDKEENTVSANVTISNDLLRAWPAISIRPGLYTLSDDGGERLGAAYLTYNDKSCKMLLDPSTPPAMNQFITLIAPDWNLGELNKQYNEITLNKPSEQLCFTYNTNQQSQPLIVNARSNNSVTNNRYRLTSTDSTTSIPYILSLTNTRSNTSFLLPNSTNTRVNFDSGGKTCFVPKFQIYADKETKEGDYSDILTFNIVTPS